MSSLQLSSSSDWYLEQTASTVMRTFSVLVLGFAAVANSQTATNGETHRYLRYHQHALTSASGVPPDARSSNSATRSFCTKINAVNSSTLDNSHTASSSVAAVVSSALSVAHSLASSAAAVATSSSAAAAVSSASSSAHSSALVASVISSALSAAHSSAFAAAASSSYAVRASSASAASSSAGATATHLVASGVSASGSRTASGTPPAQQTKNAAAGSHAGIFGVVAGAFGAGIAML
ncbi:hypothetical protein EJ04DRAFT_176949 [Polyplosphaeria fusca]|uniref:Uncharacterized protein n=1 Tax=Polyplosphaeria fusca TaxID=682080 RepID=A0A9P4R403_9PLEO|nr:hypothetical protein EJ04DRAFT_176949 [Polyplosphaeria fusca]